ncbi:MAG: hypothetical protein KKI08_04770 [Armatimonadetes bacterium]|nr:hypothetical protein [Armatimonadota bacterium]
MPGDNRHDGYLPLIESLNANFIHVFPQFMPPSFFSALDRTELVYAQDIYVSGWADDLLDPAFQQLSVEHIRRVIDHTYGVGCPGRLVFFSVGDEINAGTIYRTDTGHPEVHDFNGNYLHLTDETPSEVAIAQLMDAAMTYEVQTYGARHLYTHTSWTHIGPVASRPDLEVVPGSVFSADFGDLICMNVYAYARGVVTSPPGSSTGTPYQGYIEDLAAMSQKPVIITQVGLSTSPIAPEPSIPGFGGNTAEEVCAAYAQVWDDLQTARGAERIAGLAWFEFMDEWWKSGDRAVDENTHEDDDPEEWFGIYQVTQAGLAPKGGIPETVRTLFAQGQPHLTHTFAAGLSLVSIPVVPANADPRQLGFEDPMWLRWNPGAGVYVSYVADPTRYTWFDDAAGVPGRGYWAEFGSQASVSVAGTCPAADRQFIVPLAVGAGGGWVQIGCPWLEGVPWRASGTGGLLVRTASEEKTLAEAKAAGWCEDCAWGYQPGAGYELVCDPATWSGAPRDRLEAWQGYWFYAFQPCDLVVPSVLEGVSGQAARKTGEGGSDWWLSIMATSHGLTSASVTLGQAEHPLRMAAPPPFEKQVQLRAMSGGTAVAVDLAGRNLSPRWRLEVSADAGATQVNLSWPDMSRVPRQFYPVLVDEATGKRVYMRTSSAYTYASDRDGSARQFAVEMSGDAEPGLAVIGVVAAQAPGGTVALNMTLSSPAIVDVDVLNMAGRVVGAMCQGRECPSGLASLAWNGVGSKGTRLPGGRYLVRVVARADNGQQATALAPLQLRGIYP